MTQTKSRRFNNDDTTDSHTIAPAWHQKAQKAWHDSRVFSAKQDISTCAETAVCDTAGSPQPRERRVARPSLRLFRTRDWLCSGCTGDTPVSVRSASAALRAPRPGSARSAVCRTRPGSTAKTVQGANLHDPSELGQEQKESISER